MVKQGDSPPKSVTKHNDNNTNGSALSSSSTWWLLRVHPRTPRVWTPPFLGSLEGRGDNLKLFYDKAIIVFSREVSPQAYCPNEEFSFDPRKLLFPAATVSQVVDDTSKTYL
jgi:hypothetical protein